MIKHHLRASLLRALASTVPFTLMCTLAIPGPALAVTLPASSPGTVVSWGNDASGELGLTGYNTGLAYGTPTPISLPAGTTAVQVATAPGHGLALTSTGAVYAWGDGNNGDLGQGASTAEQDTPVEVQFPPGTEIASVAAGQYVSFAVTSGGEVYGWGDDESGQLGNGATEAPSAVNGTPELIPGLSGVTQILSAGQSFSAFVMALTSSGQVYTWGTEDVGVLGNGVNGLPSDFALTPTAISGVSDVTQIAIGAYNGLALTSSGTVYGWGNDTCDQLGNGVGDSCLGGTVEASPVQIDFPAGVQVDSIGIGGSGHGIASSSSGAVYFWGEGSAYTGSDYYTPTQFAVPGDAPVIAVDASGVCNYALTATGVLYANGAGDDSCGFGTAGSSLISPFLEVPMPSGLHVLQFAGTDAFGAAIAGPGLPGTPTVTGLSPSSGPAAGANSVTITGTGFAAGAAVYFGTTAATNVTVRSSGSIVVTAPAGTGTVDVFVALRGTSSPLTSADRYTYTPPTTTTMGSSNAGSGASSSESGKAGVGRTSSSGSSATVSLTCGGAAGSSCQMTVSLSVTEAVAGRHVIGVTARAPEHRTKIKHRTVVLAKVTITLRAGGSRKVKLTLNRAGIRLLRSRHKLRVRLTVSQSGHRVGTRTLRFATHRRR